MLQILFPFPNLASGKWGFIDQHGNIRVEAVFEKVQDFQDGVAVVYLHGKAGLMNSEGQLFVQPQYISIRDFQQGRAVAILEDSTNVIIDTSGQIMKQVPHRILGSFQQGLVRIKRKKYTDESGNRVESAVG